MNIKLNITPIYFFLFLFFCDANANWTKIWSDEFDYTGLPDSHKWTYDVGGGGWGNDESQYYTDARSENARVENGNLIIEARKESYEDNEYTSARLVSRGLGDWKYGKIEVRAKLPTGKGMWPAIWMLPSEWVYGGWPNSGEIDIMENVGYEPNTIHWSVHTESYNHSIGTQKTYKTDFIKPYNNYHIYAIEWFEDSISFLVDGIEYFQFNKESNNSNVWPFDQKFHLLLNIAVGGWGGVQGIDSSVFPQKMYVDYVRIYKKNDIKDTYSVTVNEGQNGNVMKSPDLSTYPAGSQVNTKAIPDSGFVFNKWFGTIQDTSSSLELIMNIDYNQTPEFLRPNEMVSNSQFLAGTVNWGGYGAEMGVDFGVYKTTLPLATTNPWDAQISQNGIALDNGMEYTLTVVASASKKKTIRASLGKATSPWTGYIFDDIQLTTTPQKFVIKGIMNVSAPEGRVVLDLGGSSGDVLLKEISVVQKQSVIQENTSILPSDSNIQYTGRIDFSMPDYPSFSFPGVSITAKFEGTSIGVNLEDHGAGGITTTNYFNVIIDGGEPIVLKLNSGQTTYPIVDGLNDSVHTIQIFKRTETSVGKVTFKGFVLDNSKSLLTPDPLPKRKIEFIGNSITSGYGNESSSDPVVPGFSAVNENNYNAWGAVTARNLGAQYHCTSYSGRGLVRNYDGSTSGVLPEIYNRTFADEVNSTWDHSTYVPDVVVVNLGTNDFSAETSNTLFTVNKMEFSNAYKAFITTLRGYYPNASIIISVGVMMSDYQPTGSQYWTRIQDYVSTIVEEVNIAGDNNVFYFKMDPQSAPYGEDWHPTIATHETMATNLTDFINNNLIWGNINSDCNGDIGGSAYLDNCLICVDGNTGNTACIQDCAGVWGGTATEPNVTTSFSHETCGQNNGSITFFFTDQESRSNIEFSTDGGATYPTNVKDNIGNTTLSNLAPGTYHLSTRWGNDECAVDLREVTINPEALPSATVSTTATECTSGNGSITFTFPNEASRTGIEFSIDNGATYPQEVFDNSGSYTFSDLIPETYHVWVRWSNTECPVDLATSTIEKSSCNLDCNGDPKGIAYLDDCDRCVGGNTGVEVNSCFITSLQNQFSSPLKVYPNPTYDYLYSSKNAPWVLRNILGFVVSVGNGDIIDLTKFKAGVYFVKIEDQYFRVLKN